MEGLIFSFHQLPATTKKDLCATIKEYGGEVVYVGKGITHLITTKEEIKANTFKIQDSIAKGIQVVDETFIEELVKSLPKPIKNQLVIHNNRNTSSGQSTPKREHFSQHNGNASESLSSSTSSMISRPSMPGITAPIISLLLPDSAPCITPGTDSTFESSQREIKIAVFGLGFQPTSQLQIHFRSSGVSTH